MIFIFITLLGIVSAWEELQQLIQRGSWKADMFHGWLIWETDWNGEWKLFDSHHVAFGVFMLVLFTSYYFVELVYLWQMPIMWLLFFYIRNIFMHIVFRKSEYRQWEYLYKRF